MPNPRTYALLITEADARAHSRTEPALLPIPAALVHPIEHMLRGVYTKDAVGTLYMGVEALLVAIDEDDLLGVDTAIEAVLEGWLLRKQNKTTMKW